ncbi:ATP11 protein-domain-containing protein [Chytriomyces sp. MP71]|nr:ATP11 protein-domain-containing protein [Chytriomyces sp. MP71]
MRGGLRALFSSASLGGVRQAARPDARYRDKLEARARRDGFASVEDLIAHSKPARMPATPLKPPVLPPSNSTRDQQTAASTTAKPMAGSAPRKEDGLPSFIKPLNDIVKLELLQDETPERIEIIWNEHHAAKPGMVSGVMPITFYNQLKTRGRECPLEGVEFYFMQHAFNQIYFTSLLEYKTHLTEARPKLVLTHYDDLAESKGVVLMRGEVGREGGVLKADDARLLVLMTQIFYVTGGESKKKLVELFNKTPKEFQYQAVIDEMEKLD